MSQQLDHFGFSDSCPDDDDGLTYDIMRVSQGGKVKGVILSDQPVCRRVHWYNGRTAPCFNTDCEACNNNIEGRWKGWVALMSVSGNKVVILELTAKGIKPLRLWLDDFSTLKGALLEATRSKGKINGRLFVSLSRGPLAPDGLPRCPDVARFLLKMWGLDPGLPGLGILLPRVTPRSPKEGAA